MSDGPGSDSDTDFPTYKQLFQNNEKRGYPGDSLMTQPVPKAPKIEYSGAKAATPKETDPVTDLTRLELPASARQKADDVKEGYSEEDKKILFAYKREVPPNRILVTVKPEDFLELAAEIPFVLDEKYKEPSFVARAQQLKSDLYSSAPYEQWQSVVDGDMPYLALESFNGKRPIIQVYMHEGRHRAWYFKLNNWEQFPVLLDCDPSVEAVQSMLTSSDGASMQSESGSNIEEKIINPIKYRGYII